MTGPVAAGRTADVYADAPGRIRRVYRDGRDATAEAELMRHVRAHGYPAPEVFDAEGPTIVMAAVAGPSLGADALEHPERLPAATRLLRDLLDRLADVPAPPDLPLAFGEGDALLHLDLHPFNVLLGPDGPVVIDWCTARRGPGVADRAYAYVVLRTAVKPDPELSDQGFLRARRAFCAALLDDGSDPARGWVAAAARRRLDDPFVLPAERPMLTLLGRTAIA
ncbi:phosphotransferase [Jatrophihabitans sp. YIM 134969]